MNTVCFIGAFQFLSTYIISGDLWALGVFVNGVIFHGGVRWWKWPDIVFNSVAVCYKFVYGPHLFLTRVCALIGCMVFLLNKRGSNLIHVTGVQYVLNVPVTYEYSHAAIPPCLLLGTIIACIINGASRLAACCVEAPRGTDPKEGVPKPPPAREGHPRGRPRRSYYIPTAIRARYGTGFPQAARPFLRGAAAAGSRKRTWKKPELVSVPSGWGSRWRWLMRRC